MVPRWTGPEHAKAWSVRPDLWPPGTRAVATEPGGDWPRLASAYHGLRWCPLTTVEPYMAPGVAEALVLQDRVEVRGHHPDFVGQWVEVTPCP